MCIYATGFILVYSFCSYLISSRFVESTKMLCGDFSWKVMPRIDIPSGSHTPKAPKDTELGDAQSEHTELLGWALNKAEDLFPHCLDGPCINDMYINRWHISIYICFFPMIICTGRKILWVSKTAWISDKFPLAYWRDLLLGWFW